MDEDRPPTVDRLQTVLEPMPNRVAVNSEELRDLGRFIAVRVFDPAGWIAASPRPWLSLVAHWDGSAAAASSDAISY
jgi:hypothetical protein